MNQPFNHFAAAASQQRPPPGAAGPPHMGMNMGQGGAGGMPPGAAQGPGHMQQQGGPPMGPQGMPQGPNGCHMPMQMNMGAPGPGPMQNKAMSNMYHRRSAPYPNNPQQYMLNKRAFPPNGAGGQVSS